jgi:hypothetical protein
MVARMLLVGTMLVGLSSGQAFGGEHEARWLAPDDTVERLDSSDASLLFGRADPAMTPVSLSNEQMSGTLGGWGAHGAVIGAVYGGAGYLGAAAVTGDFSGWGFAVAVGSGALGGMVGGGSISALNMYLAPRLGGGSGMLVGYVCTQRSC